MGVDFSFSANSRNNVPYFSPEADFAPLPHLTLTHMIHRHYETAWEHALTLGAGGYWQKNYGPRAILSADYRHPVRDSDVFEPSAGVARSEERRGGKECVRTCSSLGVPYP